MLPLFVRLVRFSSFDMIMGVGGLGNIFNIFIRRWRTFPYSISHRPLMLSHAYMMKLPPEWLEKIVRLCNGQNSAKAWRWSVLPWPSQLFLVSFNSLSIFDIYWILSLCFPFNFHIYWIFSLLSIIFLHCKVIFNYPSLLIIWLFLWPVLATRGRHNTR